MSRLIEAALNGDLQSLREEIQGGTDVNSINSEGFTALMCASDGDHLPCVSDLIVAGCQLDLQMRITGHTAAMFASFAGNEACLRELVCAGCNLDLTDNDGDTVWTYSADVIEQILIEQSAARDAIYEALRKNSKFSDVTIEEICSFTLRNRD